MQTLKPWNIARGKTKKCDLTPAIPFEFALPKNGITLNACEQYHFSISRNGVVGKVLG